MVYVSETYANTVLISTLYINFLVFCEVKLDHGPCFRSMCKYRSNNYFIHQYRSVFEVKLDHGLCFRSMCKYRSNKYFMHQYFSVF